MNAQPSHPERIVAPTGQRADARRRAAVPAPDRAARVARRRMLALGSAALLLVAVIAVTLWAGAGPADAGGELTPAEEIVVVAADGDTVWTLALPHAPEGADHHGFVAEVIRRNGIDAGGLRPGEALRIPRY